MTTFESEASIEEKLIQQLVEGESQWTFRGDIHTFDDLWNNFRKILIQNNKEIFDEHPLTDSEFQQVQNQLRFPTFYSMAHGGKRYRPGQHPAGRCRTGYGLPRRIQAGRRCWRLFGL